MKMLTFIAALVLTLQTPTWGQGSIGQYSESQILDLIKEARVWTNPDAQQYLNEEEKSRARRFLALHQPVLNSLGKKKALYYLKMLESNDAGKFGHSADLAYAARATFWYHRDEYSGEGKNN